VAIRGSSFVKRRFECEMMNSLSVLAITTIVVVSVKASLDAAIIRHEFLDFREIPDHAYS
jgi:hypothetical protein